MKILFIINHLSAGGAEKILSVLANTLSQKGIEVCIATVSQKDPFYELDKEISLLHITAKRLPSTVLNRFFAPFGFVLGIKKVIDDVRPDIIISFTTTMNVYSIFASKMATVPIVVSEHTNFHRAKNEFWRLARRLFYPLSDALIVLTDYDRSKYSFVKNVVRIYNPLLLENNHQNVEREKIILAVGRLERVKGFDLLLRSFARLDQKDWELVILGDGDERSNLESLAEELNIRERVKMPGIVKDVESYYRKAPIFVLSSRGEGFPGTLCEAMGYGCAVVAYDCLTGPRDIITDGTDGLLVEAENIEKLTRSIQFLIDNPDKIDTIGENAKKIAARLDVDTIAKEWLDVINALPGKKRGV